MPFLIISIVLMMLFNWAYRTGAPVPSLRIQAQAPTYEVKVTHPSTVDGVRAPAKLSAFTPPHYTPSKHLARPAPPQRRPAFSLKKTPAVALPTATPWSWSVPVLGQGSLGGLAACNPTAMSMLMAYWQERDARAKALAPGEILNEALRQGYFVNGQGMDFHESELVFEQHGYTAEIRRMVGDAAQPAWLQLRTVVLAQPVMAMVRLNLTTGELGGPEGVAHAIVVTGVSADGQWVRFNDPWREGSAREVTWAQFAYAWGSFDTSRQWDNLVLIAQPLP